VPTSRRGSGLPCPPYSEVWSIAHNGVDILRGTKELRELEDVGAQIGWRGGRRARAQQLVPRKRMAVRNELVVGAEAAGVAGALAS
jgi:hypothetical protein